MENPNNETEKSDNAAYSHVNGWAEIARALQQKGVRQKDLAAALGVTPSAITQFKQGTSQFNRRQLARIAEFLAFDTETSRKFYAEIIDARLVGEPPEIQTSSK